MQELFLLQAAHWTGAREYRACLALQPGMAEAYGGLADLRGAYLTAADIATMRALLNESTLDLESHRTIQYALGSALELTQDYSGSFAAYKAGVALSQTVADENDRSYSPMQEAAELAQRRSVFAAAVQAGVSSAEKLRRRRYSSSACHALVPPWSNKFSPATLSSKARWNCRSCAISCASLSFDRGIGKFAAYPECVMRMDASEFAELGERYLDECEAYRRTDRPYFIDKQPWNWREAGLIRLILPHAKIIDIRRAPMAACFAMYKLQLEVDSAFPYGFEHLAHFYSQYTSMMDYYETVMSGHIHLLSYEGLVERTDIEVRRLLDYCELSFEEGCLRFWETSRAVTTPSGEQVRRPIYHTALEQWRNFEPWLGPLKTALAKPYEPLQVEGDGGAQFPT